MKEKVHPKTNVCTYECACGEKFENITTSGKDVVRIEICNKCHPFYTGKQKIVDAAGMVEKFNAKYAKAATNAPKTTKK